MIKVEIRFKDLNKMRNYIDSQTGEQISNKEFRNLLKVMKKRAKAINKDRVLYNWMEYKNYWENDITINGEIYSIQSVMYVVENENKHIYKFELDYDEKIYSFKQIKEQEESVNEYNC